VLKSPARGASGPVPHVVNDKPGDTLVAENG